ncbi:MAG: DUF6090 family protein, partial [Parvularculaceae bacterium]
VMGVFVGLQVNNWNEARKDAVRERTYLTQIAAELDESIASIEYAMELSQKRAALGALLLRAVDDPNAVRAEPSRFVIALLQANYTYSPSIRSSAFEEMKSAGDLGLLRDAQLRFDLTEFYTDVDSREQWNYLRELRQTEYIKRAAGVLSLETIAEAAKLRDDPRFTKDEALAARARMLERPAFVDWLPQVAYRGDELRFYASWLERAKDLRARIRATPAVGRAERAEFEK